MKLFTYIAILISVAFITFGVAKDVLYHKYENYIKTSEELLWEIEEMCEYHNIDWGDTVCESDVWCDFCDAREALGLDYLEHYSKVK
jgi:hypothetical protein